MTIEEFIAWGSKATGSERANAQTFISKLCAALDLPPPDLAKDDNAENDYVFERSVVFQHGDGSSTTKFIDCYKQGAFVLENKKVRADVKSKTFDDAMLRAHGQAVAYVRNLPPSESRPPFVVIVDVGNVIELHSEFSQTGGAYIPFPDPRSYRIPIAALANPDIRARLRAVWLEPLSLDPSRASARVTREVSEKLAIVAKSLEAAGHKPEAVAGFLTRCLFSMFAEDVELLPKGSFKGLLAAHRADPPVLGRMLEGLWGEMDVGGFSLALRCNILKFNGKLFKTPTALPLTQANIDTLLAAAQADWRDVEPAIFGTLLEQALETHERHAFGAHYTPRSHVERLVLPTVITPLRDDWANVQAAAVLRANEGKINDAQKLVREFQLHLCSLKVLDPACGSGNFLYVTLEHLKRLEGEVLIQLEAFGDVQVRMETDRLTVDPHQLLGIEVNPRAAAIAEAVLWIGYLQWHFRTRSNAAPPQPVLRDFKNIECRDAVLTWDSMEYELDAKGIPVTRWDGRSFKSHPVTGKQVPDEAAQIPKERYVNTRQAAWPDADFITGNPPFIGAGPMRLTLGDGYVEALRGAWPEVPESADFVMFWWEHAARAVRSGRTRRFGFITTNSLRQTFNRRVVEAHLHPKIAKNSATVLLPPPTPATTGASVLRGGGGGTARKRRQTLLSKQLPPPQPSPAGGGSLIAAPALKLAFAIPDHPWVDSADGAAVRIAMTVGTLASDDSDEPGCLQTVTTESPGADGEVNVTLSEQQGEIHADLTVGANIASAKALRSNADISSRGHELGGAGFIVTAAEANALLPSVLPPLPRGEGWGEGSPEHKTKSVIREYRNGRDLTDVPRNAKVIDLFGLTADEVRKLYPAIFQHLLLRVKPERDHNPMPSVRQNWWLHRRLREDLRDQLRGLPRYIATVETAKHRTFQFLDASILPDNKLIAIALSDAFSLGVLSSSAHVRWALAAGSTLGDRPVYVKTTCFETFPFPTPETGLTPALSARIASLAEDVDAHRKRVLQPTATLPPPPAGEGWGGGSGQRSSVDSAHEVPPPPPLRTLAPVDARAGGGSQAVTRAAGNGLTLTGLYNVLEALREGRVLTAKEKAIHDAGLVAVLKSLHDELDAAVLGAYGWADLQLPRDEQTLLARLVALNAQRGEEEANKKIAYLRPAYQDSALRGAAVVPVTEQTTLAIDTPQASDMVAAPKSRTIAKTRKLTWPRTLPERMKTVATLLAESGSPMTIAQVAARIGGKSDAKVQLPEILATLVDFGRAQCVNDTQFVAV